MAGYPSSEQSVELVLAAVRGGAGIVELGVPFSDPLADGPVIQHASFEALQRGMTVGKCLDLAGEIIERSGVPLLLMGHYNPIFRYGIKRFCQEARAKGVCGLIIPDLPAEEVYEHLETIWGEGLAFIFLIPPTTSDERIHHLAELSSRGPASFLYCVSVSGTTGSRQSLPPHLQELVTRIRNASTEFQTPIAVGFGLSTPEHIAEVTEYADGAVVGSALVKLINDTPLAEQTKVIEAYIATLTGRQ
jgi:tryptophan synthase alpha subunit